MHLWVGDVVPNPDDPETALVRVFQPSEGKVLYRDPETGAQNWRSRCEILRTVYDRVPLTEQPREKAVGWKNPMINDTDKLHMTVFWRTNNAGRAFMQLFRRYIKERPIIRTHPYLFATAARDPMMTHALAKLHAAVAEQARRL